MANSYGQFTGWVSVSYVVKSEPSCTSHKPSASYQRWLVRGDLVHGICPHAATQSYILSTTVESRYLLSATESRRGNMDHNCYLARPRRPEDTAAGRPRYPRHWSLRVSSSDTGVQMYRLVVVTLLGKMQHQN